MNILTEVQRVARRFACRPGCRFVSAREVGIAVFVMDLRIIVIEPKDVPPIDEFLLRSLRLSIDGPEELSSFLGLDPRTVENRLVELRRAELIDVLPIDDSRAVRCRLTARGEMAASSLQRAELREVTVPRVVYHGFLRRPLLFPDEKLLRPRDLKELGLPAIPPIPSRPPRPEEITLEELAAVIRSLWQRKQKGRPPELITVRSILSNVRTMYIPAVLLQYELTGKKQQQQVAFAIDGILDEEAAHAFADRKGPERVPELLADGFTSTMELASEFMKPHIVKRLQPLGDVDEIVEKLEAADAELAEKKAVAVAEDRPDTKQVLRKEIEQLQAGKAQLEQQLAQRKARRLRTHDCRYLLKTTLRDVKERLVIVSAFLSSYVVDNQFLKDLEAVLTRGVHVWIAYGMGGQGERQGEREKSGDWKEAESGLRAVQKRHPESFRFVDLGNTHEKILIRDRDFVVSGSFNWLSFRADPRKKFRYEDALLVTEPEAIEEYFREITGRFGQK